jgi:cell division protein FtsB
MKIQEKDNIPVYKRMVKSQVFFIILIPIFLMLLFGIGQNFYYRFKVQKDLDKLNAEIANLSKQKEDLTKLVDYYKNQSNLEKEARVRLNLKKEGENVVIILPQATSTSESGESISGSVESAEDLPNYKQWRYYFFGR